jgi:hypothetical protein
MTVHHLYRGHYQFPNERGCFSLAIMIDHMLESLLIKKENVYSDLITR